MFKIISLKLEDNSFSDGKLSKRLFVKGLIYIYTIFFYVITAKCGHYDRKTLNCSFSVVKKIFESRSLSLEDK